MNDVLHLVCAGCDSIVRVPAARLTEGPRCPKCHGSLLSDHPLELNAARFEKHVSRTDLPVVVDFWAPWCGPCRMMAPHFERVAQQMRSRARFVKVNTEEQPALGQRFAIRSIPTLMVMRSGMEVARQAGAMDAGGLMQWLSQNGVR